MSTRSAASDGTDPNNLSTTDAQQPLTIYLVKRLQLVIQGLVDNALREFEVTPLQYTILYILESTGSQSSASLARAAFLRPQTMHEIVRTLEKRGFVTREPDPASKRSLLVKLTPVGTDLLIRCAPSISNVENQLLEHFSPGQQALFRECLEAGIDAMGDEAARRHVDAARV